MDNKVYALEINKYENPIFEDDWLIKRAHEHVEERRKQYAETEDE